MTLQESDLDKWRQQYDDVFLLDVSGKTVVFRSLTYAEFKSCISEEYSSDMEDHVVQIALLYPSFEDFEKLPAGIFYNVVETILSESGFVDIKKARQVLEDCRQDVLTDIWNTMKTFVMSTMTAYKEEELDMLTFKEMMHKVALAERILEVKQTIAGVEGEIKFELIDPVEEAEKQRKEAEKFNSKRGEGQATYEDPIAQKLREALH